MEMSDLVRRYLAKNTIKEIHEKLGGRLEMEISKKPPNERVEKVMTSWRQSLPKGHPLRKE